MRLVPFELRLPESLDEAIETLSTGGGDTRLVAGGTALLSLMRMGLVRPDRLVSLHRVPGLDALEVGPDGALRIGARTTLARLARSPLVRRGWPLLAEASGKVATPGIRSAATLGGNLGYAEAASDPAPALLCLDAEVHVAGPSGRRTVALDGFFAGFYQAALQPGEVIVEVRLPPLAAGVRSGYVKFCPRSAEDRPLIGVAARLALDAAQRVVEVRLGLAGAAATPLRAREAEARLRGGVLDDAAVRGAAEAAAREADPLSDLMGSADYRREMIRVWVERLLSALRERPSGRPAA